LLTQAEESFGLYFVKNSYYNAGWAPRLVYSISLHKKDREILSNIQTFFNCGTIYDNHGPNTIKYSVNSINDMQIIINHFDRYPLLTTKLSNYKLFKLAYKLIKNKDHLSIQGIEKLVEIKSLMNLGLNPELKLAFPEIAISNNKDKYKDCFDHSTINIILNPNWVSAFTSGEGCFMVDIVKCKSFKLGKTVVLRFIITQHKKDELLMKKIMEIF
jgi:hypothetical protein